MSLCARLVVALAIAGCASTTVTLRSHHFHLTVPSDWQVVEAYGGERPTLLRAPATAGSPAIELRVYAWTVPGPPADVAGDVLHRLAGMNVLGLAGARSDDAEPCPDRAVHYFVFGKPARAIHLTSADGRRLVVTAGESGGSLVGVVAAVAAGGSGCTDANAMDAAVERLAASISDAGDPSAPPQPPPVTPIWDPTKSVR
jgi:hypothetical protein